MYYRIDQYLELLKTRPELFRSVGSFPICTDRDTLIQYEEETGRPIGLIFDNRPYSLVLADLVEGNHHTFFRYMRVVPAEKLGGSVVLPVWQTENGEQLFGLLCNDRHAPRIEGMLELPRGHLAPGMTARDNAVAELCQEMGVSPCDIVQVKDLGSAHPDTGLTASIVNYYEILLKGSHLPTGQIGHEGIRSVRWIPESELRKLLSDGTITCGFTHTAYLKHLLAND